MVETGYLFQAVLIVAWWLGISLNESIYRFFEYPGIERALFLNFLFPDLIIIFLLSLVRGYRKSRDLQLVILGGFLYATLFCVSLSYATLGGFISTTVMLLGLFYNFFLCYSDQTFIASRSSSFLVNGIKTVVQIVSIWFISLVLMPILILKGSNSSLIPECSACIWVGGLLFTLCSLIGLTSSYFLVKFGRGTPLPLDQTNQLVVQGPYHYIRNPMAVAGIGQGISIAIAYASIPILIYSLLGAVVWHLIVRPFEEKDMRSRFGEPYEVYCREVRCWLPFRKG